MVNQQPTESCLKRNWSLKRIELLKNGQHIHSHIFIYHMNILLVFTKPHLRVHCNSLSYINNKAANQPCRLEIGCLEEAPPLRCTRHWSWWVVPNSYRYLWVFWTHPYEKRVYRKDAFWVGLGGDIWALLTDFKGKSRFVTLNLYIKVHSSLSLVPCGNI